ncbi:autotransporter outer membrane beta-barrel domain-containing protein [Mucilaginibacter lappiensis]|uniref:Chaperone of endosialidase n=1 Tax=Mucilaginibacter lappiensis TaxID=354630 RepID=A0A841J6I4_9SPHI|nr:hypothetical protein [Mucilaginibacter lappiensis]MBB6126350.1 hypothetical protein [Mucilaginibacter lappiensis]
MKKVCLTIISVLSIVQLSYAQWTTAGNNIYNSNTGNVGIGINSGTAKFAVYQSTALGSITKNNLLLSSVGGAAANSVQNNIWLVRNAAGSDFTTSRLHDGISIDGSYVSPQTDTRTWWERDPTSDVQSWGTAANTYLTIKQGNLGLGTTTPAAKLDVTVASSTYTNNIKFGDATPGYLTAGTVGIFMSNNVGTPVFTVLHTGNVGIGQTNPQNKLDVNGTVHSKAVTIDLNGWSDYVFKKDYQLRPLSEVKAYIDQNQHLPEIPSEQEMVKKGLDVSEMNKLLMKKVEELTLYLIEKDQNEKKQEQTNQELKNQVTTLRVQLEFLSKVISAKQK